MRKIILEIPDADERWDSTKIWEPKYLLNLQVEGSTIIIQGNRDGLLSLAKHCLVLCQDEAQSGDHRHFDACDKFGELDPGSASLILTLKS